MPANPRQRKPSRRSTDREGRWIHCLTGNGSLHIGINVAHHHQRGAATDALRGGWQMTYICRDEIQGFSSDGFKEIPDAATVAARNTPEEARGFYEGLAKGVAEWGFNVNFAPVVDLAVNPNNQVIAKYGRAYGKTGEVVVSYAAEVIAAHHDARLLTSLKHFPGHGSSTADSHEGFVDITKTWKDSELEPYRALISGGYQDFVMIGHLIDTNVDPSGLPSSLSKEWIDGVLRGQLGFKGVVITDDLEMGAIRDHFNLKETVVKAVQAGVDVLLFSNTAYQRATLGDEVRAILLAEAEADPAFKARIEESYNRIVALKSRIGAENVQAQ